MRHGCRITQGSVPISAADDPSVSQSVLTQKAPTRAFSWLKAPTSAFTFKIYYAKRAMIPR